MGAWGAGSFENDTALDWAAECSSTDDIKAKFLELEALDDNENAGHDVYVDADIASEVVAAAETVAMLMGCVSKDFPAELRSKFETASSTNPTLIEQAKFAVSRILAESELLDLWSEGDGENNEWNMAMTGLIDRLNADVPDNPPAKEDIEKAQGYLTTCVICDKDIAADKIFQLEFRDLSTEDGLYVSRGLYCHLSCLNGKLHPKHMIQNWRFKVDETEIDRLLDSEPD